MSPAHGGAPRPDRWERIEVVCFEAMALPPGDRDAFLDRRCGGDRELRARVDELLEAFDREPDFLERPAVAMGGALDEAAPEEGERIGRYQLIRPIGHGGMGDVHLAAYHGDGFTRTVALKVIRKGLDTERVLERFRLERRILAELRHPNIAQLVDGGATEDGRPYFVMEWVEGEPIDDYCARRRLSLRARLELVATLCGAIQYAHQNLVVHRDIKPANILVTPDGRPKLLDFGIGKILTPDDTETEVTQVEERAMTPAYAAPEILRGEPATTAVDVYGIGVLLYLLLTGRLPSDATSTQERLQTLQQVPRRPSTVTAAAAAAAPAGRLSSELDAVVLKALAVEPSERYESVGALADDLRRYLEGRPVRARAPGLFYAARKFVGRHRLGVGVTAVAVAGLVGGTLYTLQQSRRVAAERDKALAVRGFLLETFGAAGADQALGEAVTARALLDGQAVSVEESYADDPELRREMMTVLAEGYERLGLFAEAEEWASRVVEEAREASDPSTLAAGLGLLGWVRHQRGAPGEAEGILEEAVGLARGARSQERTLARTLNDLGVVQEALGKYEEAGVSHQEAMELRAGLFGENHRSVAVSASNLSVIRYRQGDFEGAVREAGRALEVVRTAFGPDHQRAIIVQSNLAVFKQVAGDLAGAEADYRDLWDRHARTQGPSHPVTIRVMGNLASLLRQQEKWAEAESVLRDVLRILESQDAPSPAEVASIRVSLGGAISARGGSNEAELLLNDGLSTLLEIYGPDHVEVGEAQIALSLHYERVDSLPAAVTWMERASETLTRALGPGHVGSLTQRVELGRLLLAAGRVGEARSLLTETREPVLTALGADHPLLAQIQTLLEEYPASP